MKSMHTAKWLIPIEHTDPFVWTKGRINLLEVLAGAVVLSLDLLATMVVDIVLPAVSLHKQTKLSFSSILERHDPKIAKWLIQTRLKHT